MTQASTPTYPKILPIDPARIPDLIKASRRWFPWRAGPIKDSGKFDKIPVNPSTGRSINPLDPVNWLSFQDALNAYHNGVGNGLGIALSDQHPITVAGQPFFLTAVDFDNCVGRMSAYEALWRHQLGKAYVEASPSGNGLRMLGLSRILVHSGNANDGREMYANKHFVTITGNGGRGTLCDFTSGIVALEQLWFGSRTAPKLLKKGLLGQPA